MSWRPGRVSTLAAASLAFALAACEPPPLPQPRILAVEPTSMLSSDARNVAVTVDAILPFRADYDLGQMTVERSLLLSIGPLLVGDSRYENNGVLVAFVPSRLNPGIYDVTVTLVGDRRVAILEQAFTVNPGPWPEGYSIDPIPSPQRANVPFAITIRATGTNPATFQGTVDLMANRGLMSPARTGPFTAGVRLENVVFSTPAAGIIITVRDLLGTTASSGPFVVN